MTLPVITLRRFESLILSKTVSVSEIASYCRTLAQAGEDILELNAFMSMAATEEIQGQAQASQQRWDAGTPLSPIDGLPISVKANLAVANQPLTAGSAVLGATTTITNNNNNNPTDTPAVGYTADVVRSLQQSGAIVMGITQMDEFGMGSLGTNKYNTTDDDKNNNAGATKNPLSFGNVADARREAERGGSSLKNMQSAIQAHPEQLLEMHEQFVWEESSSSSGTVSAGGSSCGSAASVAHGSSLLSLGSDTGGSVRLPAAWCHLAGLRPTYGRLSRHGLVSYASSFDTVGVLANSTECIGTAFTHLLKCNDTLRDSTLSSTSREFSWTDISKNNVNDDSSFLPASGLKVGIPEAFSVAECPANVRDAWSRSADLLCQAGATVEIVPKSMITPEVLQRSLASYFILVSAEASSNLARYDGFRYGINYYAEAISEWDQETSPFSLLEHQYASARTKGFGPEVIRRILCGTAALSANRFHTHYEGAAKIRAELTGQLTTTLLDYDVLLVPTVLFPPPQLDADVDPTEVFANDIMTIPASLAGLPALSVPMHDDGSSSRFPPAMQLIGRPFDESKLLRAAIALESRSRKAKRDVRMGLTHAQCL